MNVRYLSPNEIRSFDESGRLTDWVEGLKTATERFEKPSMLLRKGVTPEIAYALYSTELGSLNWHSHQAYRSYNSELSSKFGPQGGNPSWDEVLTAIHSYYELADVDVRIPECMYQARNYLLKVFKEAVSEFGAPDTELPATWYDTQAGVPTGARKGSYYAETQAMKPWRHMLPAVPGTRRMRNATRLIFMDANPNVRYLERQLTGVRNWLKTRFPNYFGSWLNESVVIRPMMSQGLREHRVAIETDYVKMDQHFSWTVVRELLLPLYEVLLPHGYLSFAAAIEELFIQELFLGDCVISGLHNLFSGQAITNDFETLYTIILQLAAVMTFDYRGCLHAALGDDSVLILPKRVKYSEGLMVLDWLRAVSEQCNMVIHTLGKSVVANGDIRYLRKVYSLHNATDKWNNFYGEYPTVLALNNIVQPERPLPTPGMELSAVLQRLDGTYHNTVDSGFFRNFVLQRILQPVTFDPETPNRADWWERVYGERWSPDASRTFCAMYGLTYVEKEEPLESTRIRDSLKALNEEFL